MAETWSFGEDMARVTDDVFASINERMSASNTDRYIDSAAGNNYFEGGSYKVSSNRPLDLGSTPANFNIGNYSVVGINANKAQEVALKINSTVENTLKPLTDKLVIDSSIGFKGSQVTNAFEDYVAKVKGYIQSLISDLEAFSDKLVEIANAYQTNDQTLGTKITGVVGGAFAASNTMFNPQHATQQAPQGYTLDDTESGDGSEGEGGTNPDGTETPTETEPTETTPTETEPTETTPTETTPTETTPTETTPTETTPTETTPTETTSTETTPTETTSTETTSTETTSTETTTE